MPKLTTAVRNRIFLMRLGFALVGTLVALGFFYVCYRFQSTLLKSIGNMELFSLPQAGSQKPQGPDLNHAIENMQTIGVFIFAIFVAIGEYVTRRKLRTSGIFPKDRRIPWTY